MQDSSSRRGSQMATATVHALSTGSLTLPERFFITPADQEARRTVPSLSFLVQHNSAKGRCTRILFDLGIRRDVTLYPEKLQKHLQTRRPFSSEPDVLESLAAGDLGKDDIHYVFLSHVHWDHVGLPADFTNPKTKFVIGPGAGDLLSGRSALNIGPHSHFEKDLLPSDRTIELPNPDQKSPSSSPESPGIARGSIDLTWSSESNLFPPFPHVMDLFGDQTVLLLNAPGHLPGHINMAVCISSNPAEYVVLAGDACHDIRLFTGERDIATWRDAEGNHCCIHADIPTAKATIAKLRQIEQEGVQVTNSRGLKEKARVEVVFAHNWQWEEDARRNNRFFPGQL